MSTILVFGASGAVGRFVLPRLTSTPHRVLPVSRHADQPGWLRAGLENPRFVWPAVETVLSLGPLDAFADWLERYRSPALRRVVALSSMSADSKLASADPDERALAQRLLDAERRVRDIGAGRGIAVTLFRPTLIYGGGTDRTLAPLARRARRWHVLPVPLHADGLRQPVHARELAAACIAALDNPATYGNTYALGGGERLTFAAMLRRLRVCVRGPVLIVPVPTFALRFLHRLGGASFTAGAIARLREPLVADNSAAERDFGYAPGPFDARAALPAAGAEGTCIQS